MKIDNPINRPGGTSIGETRRGTPGKAPGVQSSSTSDVQLSGASAQLSNASDSAAFDSVRVSEIRQAIAEGRFKINAGAIADKLISTAQELVNSQRQA